MVGAGRGWWQAVIPEPNGEQSKPPIYGCRIAQVVGHAGLRSCSEERSVLLARCSGRSCGDLYFEGVLCGYLGEELKAARVARMLHPGVDMLGEVSLCGRMFASREPHPHGGEPGR